MTKSAQDRCCDENRKNIPWYVNGTLSDRAIAALREHLKYCGDCQTDLRLHERMQASVLGRELTPMQPATMAEDIIGDLDRDFGGWAMNSRSVPSFVAVAAGIAVLGVGLFMLLYPKGTVETGNQIFETATSAGSPGSIDYVLQVQFEEQISESERARIATELDGAVKWAVNDKGIYEVHVRLAAPSLQALQEYEELAD